MDFHPLEFPSSADDTCCRQGMPLRTNGRIPPAGTGADRYLRKKHALFILVALTQQGKEQVTPQIYEALVLILHITLLEA
jgi:hypothetical protein